MRKNIKKLLLLVLCIAVVVGMTACGKKKDSKKSGKVDNKDPESLLESYFEAFKDGDMEAAFKCLMPEDSMETYFDTNGITMDVEDVLSGYTEIAKAFVDGLKDEDYELEVEYDVKALEEIDDLDELKKEVRSDFGVKSLEDFQEDKSIKKFFEKNLDIDVDDIDNLAFAKVKNKYTLGEEKIYSDSELIAFYEYDGAWYMLTEPDYDYSDMAEDIQNNTKMYKALKSVVKEFNSDYSDFQKEAKGSKKSSSEYDDDDDDDWDDDDDSSKYDDDDDWDDDDDDDWDDDDDDADDYDW